MFESFGDWRPAPRCKSCKKIACHAHEACPSCGHHIEAPRGISGSGGGLIQMLMGSVSPAHQWYEVVIARPRSRPMFLFFGPHVNVTWEVKPTDSEAVESLVSGGK